MTGNVRVT